MLDWREEYVCFVRLKKHSVIKKFMQMWGKSEIVEIAVTSAVKRGENDNCRRWRQIHQNSGFELQLSL